MRAPEIAAFLPRLATGQRVSSSTQNQALSAVLFLHRHVLRIEVGAIAMTYLHVLNRGGLGVRSPFDRL